MKFYNLKTHSSKSIYLLLACFLFSCLACQPVSIASGKSVSSKTENQKTQANPEADSSKTENKPAENSTINVDGVYKFDDYRAGQGGYTNNLTIKKNKDGKINVYFEGTYAYPANGAETFHETSAEGDLMLNANTAGGKLTEEGSGSRCAVELNFSGEQVNLKSSDCNLNVKPDGVYKKGSDKSAKEDIDGSYGDIPEERETTTKNSSGDKKPFIQYDADGTPNSVVNLMATAEDREGCSEEILFFSGKVLTVDNSDDSLYEFTLVNGSRKRQKFVLQIIEDDKLSPDDLRSIIKIGNNLEVSYIDCGNAPIASPLAIYKK